MTNLFYLLPIFVVRWLLTVRVTINTQDLNETLFDIFMGYNDDEVNKTHFVHFVIKPFYKL